MPRVRLPIPSPDRDGVAARAFNRTPARRIACSVVVLAGQAVAVHMFVPPVLVVLHDTGAAWARVALPVVAAVVLLAGLGLLAGSIMEARRRSVIDAQAVVIGACLLSAVALAAMYVRSGVLH
ncbi:MAG: hypothetical protein ACIAS6_12225 [Phycisphaerales bacterium JB060]